MQVHGWCDAGLQMVRCRSPDVQILETESRNTFGENQCYQPLTTSDNTRLIKIRRKKDLVSSTKKSLLNKTF